MPKLYKGNAACAIAILTSSGLPSNLQNPASLFNELLTSSTDDNGLLLPGSWMAEMTGSERDALRSAVKYMSEHYWENTAKQLPMRTLIKSIIEAPGDDFLSRHAHACVSTYHAACGTTPRQSDPGERGAAPMGALVTLSGGERKAIAASQEQVSRTMRTFSERCPDVRMIANPLVDLACDEVKSTRRFASADERAARLAEAEDASRRLWHMAPAATPTDLLVELMMQQDNGAADLVLLEHLGVLRSTDGRVKGIGTASVPQPPSYPLPL